MTCGLFWRSIWAPPRQKSSPPNRLTTPRLFAIVKPPESAARASLVGHGEDAVPVGGRLDGEIFLAAEFVDFRWSVVGPPRQHFLKCALSFRPIALEVERAGARKFLQPLAQVPRGSVLVETPLPAHQFKDADGLVLALHADEVQV